MSFNVGETVGPYRIIAQLGQGGMATVYKAYHAALDRYVALKVLHPAFLEDPNFLARFQREARVVAKLDHPNIVPIFDYAEHEGRPYLVMKFIEGETLKAELGRGPLSSDRILQIVKAVGVGLSFAHKRGILHRDIKPSNVLLSGEGQIYLADFGLARIAQSGSSTLTSDMVLGTPQYISPEQALGKRDLDEGTDIYSFGVMLYELTVGKVPFSADTPFSVIHDHIYSPLPLPHTVNPTVSEELERVLLKALAKDRVDRYKDVHAMVDAFEQAWSVSMPPGPLAAGITEKVESPAPGVPSTLARTVLADVPVSQGETQTEAPRVIQDSTPLVSEESQSVAEEPVPAPATPEKSQTAALEPASAPVPEEGQTVAVEAAALPVLEESKHPEAASAKPPAPPAATWKSVPKAPILAPTTKKPWVWAVVAFVLVLVFVFGLIVLRGAQRRRQVTFATQTARVQAAIPTKTSNPALTQSYPAGILFKADFNNGVMPKDIKLDPPTAGWVTQEDALCASGAAHAGIITGDGWLDYAVKFRLKLDEGMINLNIRQRNTPDGANRYLIGVGKTDISMNKQIGNVLQSNLALQSYFFPPNTWMDVTIVVQGNRLLMLVNGVIVVDYSDGNGPFDAGTFTLETLDGTSACVDELVVYDEFGKPRYDLLYEQRFETDQALRGWEFTNAEGIPNQAWHLSNGALCTNWHNWAVLRDLPLTDFTLAYHLLLKSGSAHMNFRLGNDYRYYTLLQTADPEVFLKKDSKAQAGQRLATGNVELLSNQWNEVVFNIIGGHIRFWVNGKPVIDFTDQSPLGAGTIAIESLDAQGICIDDVVITLPSLVQRP
jgi:serine/threonine protein kinase